MFDDQVVKTEPFYGNYRGLVVDNNDPEKLGRIKVKVYPMFKGIEDPDQIPWAVPAMGLFAGAGTGFGAFAVPEENSFVYVFFEAGDIYQPVYFAEAQTAQTGIPLASQVDYPYSKVWETPTGIALWINSKPGAEQIVVYHPSGSYIEVTQAGNVIVYGSNTVTAQAQTGDASVIAAAKNVNLTAGQNIQGIAAKDITFTAAQNFDAKATMSAKMEAGASVDITAGINASVTAVQLATLSGALVSVLGLGGVHIRSTVSLKTALDALCDALTAWTGIDSRGDTSVPQPSTITSIQLAKTLIDTVLI
jgi:hypothetical protein